MSTAIHLPTLEPQRCFVLGLALHEVIRPARLPGERVIVGGGGAVAFDGGLFVGAVYRAVGL